VKLAPNLSALIHRFTEPFKQIVLECKSARHAAGFFPRLRIPLVERKNDSANSSTIICLRKRQRGALEIEADTAWLRSRNGFSTAWRRLGVFVSLVSQPEIPSGEWVADLGDWVHAEGPLLGFCTNFRQTLLVPDRGFLLSGGYATQRCQALAAPVFEDRQDIIYWRGSPTGSGKLFTLGMDPRDPLLRQRIRMCLLLRDIAAGGCPEVDVRLAAGSHLPIIATAHYESAGIIGPTIAQSVWCQCKFAIDIDGHANAFSNLFVRLLFGCCVIKIASPLGFRQWYYDFLQPWQHYIPVAADLSDLVDKLEWCQRHSADCRTVAAQGQALAFSLTIDSEFRRALQTIRSRHQDDC